MLPVAHLDHTTIGRARIRIPSKRGEIPYFMLLKQQLFNCPGVSGLETNPLTGSVLIIHAAGIGVIAEYAEKNGLFRLNTVNPGRFPVITEIASNLRVIDKGVNTLSGGGLDIASLAFLGLIGMAIAQMRKGHIMPPGITLLWYAVSIMLMTRKR
jgi:hypothetical protein